MNATSLNEATIYIFVRGDLKEEDQLVQAAHAVFAMARSQVLKDAHGEPRIVALDGGSREKAFARTLRRISTAIILHTVYTDPDKLELGPTAAATAPLTREQSVPLANYRLRRYSPVAQQQSAASDASAEVAEMESSGLPGEPVQGLA